MNVKNIKIPVLVIVILLMVVACTNSKIYESDSDSEITNSNSQNTVDSISGTDGDSFSSEIDNESPSYSYRESESLSESGDTRTPDISGGSKISITPSPAAVPTDKIIPTATPTKMARKPVNYYVSSSLGNDANNGMSPDTPWKTLGKVSSREYFPGDKILLKANDIWTNGDTLILKGNGTAINPITVSMYGSGKRPKISPDKVDAICISGSGLSGWEIMHLELSNAKTGIDLKYEHDYGNDYIWIENIYFHSMNQSYNSKTYNKITQQQRDVYLDHGNQSGGIYVRTQTNVGTKYHFNQPVMLTNLTIKDCEFYDCDFAIWTGATINGAFQPAGKDYGRISGLTIKNCKAKNLGMWGFNITFTDNGIISDCTFEDIGFLSNRFGACTLLVAYANNVLFDNMTVINQHRHPDQLFDAVGFDFEGGTNNCGIINSKFIGIDGPAIMFTYNLDNPNYNVLVENNLIEDFSRNYPFPLPAINFVVKEGVPNATGIIRNNTYITYKEGLPDYGLSIMSPVYTQDPYSSFLFSNNSLTTRKSSALGKSATSSNQRIGFEASKAIDGNVDTYWATNGHEYPAWIQIDLGQKFAIDTVNQQFANFSEWKYWIAVSDDPNFKTYSTIVDRTSGTRGTHFTHRVDDLKASGRYVRLTIIDGKGHWATSSEFRIFVK